MAVASDQNELPLGPAAAHSKVADVIPSDPTPSEEVGNDESVLLRVHPHHDAAVTSELGDEHRHADEELSPKRKIGSRDGEGEQRDENAQHAG